MGLLFDFIFEEQWLTDIYTEKPPDGAMSWPNLRICNRNLKSGSRFEQASIVDPYEIAHLQGGLRGLEFYDELQADFPLYENMTARQRKIDEITSRFKIEAHTSERWKIEKSLAVKCQDMLIYCDGQKGFTSGRPFCSCSEYMVPADEDTCFHINVSRIALHANFRGRTGYYSAIQFLLNPKTNDYYPSLINGHIGDAGISVRVYFGHGNDYLGKYTRALCLWDCELHSYFLECQCVQQGSGAFLRTEVPRCNHREGLRCSNLTEGDEWLKQTWPGGFNYDRCTEECKDPCEYDTISTSISTSKFSAKRNVKALATYLNRMSNRSCINRTYDEEEVQELIVMDLFYETPEYTVIERVNRVSIDELISNIGGTLGAWTGISFITFFQVFVYLIYGLKLLAQSFCNRIVDRMRKPWASAPVYELPHITHRAGVKARRTKLQHRAATL